MAKQSGPLGWTVLIVVLVMGFIIMVQEEPPPAPANTAADRQVAATPTDRLKSSIERELGDSNRRTARVQEVQYFEATGRINVRWSINDNLTTGLIRASARRDAVDILKTIAQSGLAYESVFIRGTFSMADRYGNAEESPVISADYPRAVIQRINWSNFNQDNIFGVAESATVHPEFR